MAESYQVGIPRKRGVCPVLLDRGNNCKIVDQSQLIETFDDNTRVSFGYYYMIFILPGFLIIGFFRIRHMLLDIHRTRRGLQQFFTCHGKERWGPPVRVKEWQRNAIHHLIAQRETLDNDIWQMKNRRNNLAEMEKEEQNRLSERIISEINAKAADDMEKSRFIEFEIARCKVKIEELKKRIRQKDSNIHSMEIAKQQVNTCLKSYSRGKNPRLPVQKYIRGLFFDLK